MATNDVIILGDAGTELLVDCGEDLAGALDPTIHVRKPDGSEVAWAAEVVDATWLRYVTRPGDVDQAGPHLVQAGFTLGGWTGRGQADTFLVLEAFSCKRPKLL